MAQELKIASGKTKPQIETGDSDKLLVGLLKALLSEQQIERHPLKTEARKTSDGDRAE